MRNSSYSTFVDLSELLLTSSLWSVFVHVTLGFSLDNFALLSLRIYFVCTTPATGMYGHLENMQNSFS